MPNGAADDQAADDQAADNQAGDRAGSNAPLSVPNAPLNLAATPGNGQIALSWADGGGGTTSYTVYRRFQGIGSYVSIGTPSGLTFTDTGLTNGQGYDYEVTALNAGGESPPSQSVTATPSAPTQGDPIMYCTLPLQISENQQNVGALTRINWKQFQTAPQLTLCLQDGSGLPMNLTGATVTLRLSTLIGSTLQIAEPMTLSYAVGGIVSYHFAPSDVAVAGTFSLEIEAVMANGDVLYFPSDGNVLFVISRALGGP